MYMYTNVDSTLNLTTCIYWINKLVVVCVCVCVCVMSIGNMFSTVRGHVFRWTLLRDEEAVNQELDPDAILEFVQFTNSAYTIDSITEALENKAREK